MICLVAPKCNRAHLLHVVRGNKSAEPSKLLYIFFAFGNADVAVTTFHSQCSLEHAL